MKTLVDKAAALIDAKFNPRVIKNQLHVRVPDTESDMIFFQEVNNEIKLTNNFAYLRPEEFNRYLEMVLKNQRFKPMNINGLFNLIDKKIEFEYIDADNGNIKGVGVIKAINKRSPGDFDIEFESESGDILTSVYIYGDRQPVLAGDDGNQLMINVLK